MKHFYRMFLALCIIGWQAAYATETEPNNTSAQASTLSQNGSNSGKISPAGDVDWWKLTTTADGKLTVRLTPLTHKKLWLYLYDNDGTTVLQSGNADTAFSKIMDGLATGTYYLKVAAVSSTDTLSYNISNTLTTATPANDAEPNNSKATAVTLAQNGTATGHVGYYYNKVRDTSDWYKLTTTSDSKLKLKVTPANGQALSVTIYANNGISYINSASGSSAFTLTTDGVKRDVYYIKINASSSSGFTPYTLSDSVLKPTNDSFILAVNFAYKNKISKAGGTDWWRITTTKDGQLTFTLTPVSGKYLYVYLYDHDRTTVLNSSYSNGKFTQSTDGLAAGTYYAKVVPYYNTDTSTYVLADTLTTPAQTVDAEPNGTRAQALTLSLNGSKTGHVGYLYNNKRDTADWYKITTTGDGALKLNLTPANGQYIYMYLYDNDGVTLLNSAYSNSAFSMITDGLAAGTYYVRVNCYYNSGFAPYTISNTFTAPAQANDSEPNDTKATAKTFTLNGTVTGHVGYYYNNKRDSADWYKLTTNGDGALKLDLTPANGSYIYVYLYDNDGTTVLNSGYSNAAFSISTDGLAAGTYYLRVNCYYNTGFTPYTLKNTLTKPAQANDTEPNGNKSQALSFTENSTVTGHVGYYYNHRSDTADWYKLAIGTDGMIKLNLTPANGSYIYVYLYDNDGSTVINSAYSNAAFTLSTDGLAKGTYYVRVNCYYNPGFTPYTLSNTLTTYSYTTDSEPNNHAAQASTMPANSTVTGHVGFYYNNSRDVQDWWKLAYSGTGHLNFTFNLAPHKIDNAVPYTYFYVYKDTAASPIYSAYFNSASNAISLTSIAKGNYYIKIIPYYNTDFVAYSISNSSTSTLTSITAAGNNKAIDELGIVASFNVYPNPATTQLHVTTPSRGNVASVVLRDAAGKAMWNTVSGALSSAGGTLNIDVSRFPAGTYFLTIVDKSGNTATQKVVVAR